MIVKLKNYKGWRFPISSAVMAIALSYGWYGQSGAALVLSIYAAFVVSVLLYIWYTNTSLYEEGRRKGFWIGTSYLMSGMLGMVVGLFAAVIAVVDLRIPADEYISNNTAFPERAIAVAAVAGSLVGALSAVGRHRDLQSSVNDRWRALTPLGIAVIGSVLFFDSSIIFFQARPALISPDTPHRMVVSLLIAFWLSCVITAIGMMRMRRSEMKRNLHNRRNRERIRKAEAVGSNQ